MTFANCLLLFFIFNHKCEFSLCPVVSSIGFQFSVIRTHGYYLLCTSSNVYHKCNYVKTIEKENIVMSHLLSARRMAFLCMSCICFTKFIDKE